MIGAAGRRRLAGWILAAILAILFLVVPPMVWLLSPPQPVQTILVDADPDQPYAESHRWISWLLRHWRYPEPVLIDGLTGLDAALAEYYTALHDDPDELPEPTLLYINGMYPLTERGSAALHEAVMSGVTLVAELTSTDVPMDYYVRRELETLLGIRSTGWIGRRIRDLSRTNELPATILEQYLSRHPAGWNFEGGGTVFAHHDGRVLVVPEEGNTLSGGVYLTGNEGEPSERPRYFTDWFMVVETIPEAAVVAEFSLEVNPAGAALLAEAGLPSRFPAAVEYHSGVHTALFLGGDFSNFPNLTGPFWYGGLSLFRERVSIPAPDAYDHSFWTFYAPLLRATLTQAGDAVTRPERISDGSSPDSPPVIDGLVTPARVSQAGFEVYGPGGWTEMYVHGVNLGMAIPGFQFTDFPRSDLQYLEWFEGIHELHVNTIRIYTLQAPAFYRALARFNLDHPDRPLRLLHEIWPEEHPPEGDILQPDYMEHFAREIRYVVDAVHGNGNVPPRTGRASGVYRHDVSPWVIGYLVGREIEPSEALATDAANPGYQYDGRYFSTSDASPTEAWHAWASDETARYEAERYGAARPISIVSWPPLDPLRHPSEWAAAAAAGALSGPYNDSASVDINRIEVSPSFHPGFFGSYHIYPNYPDFIITNPAYAQYRDDHGQLNYGGYLREFIAQHSRYPALVAEFGMATGQGVAHYSPDGLHHGGVDETTQGRDVIRMFEAIEREGYIGAVIFEWMDEWVKKTWTTEPFMIPFERNAIWHNSLDPEQNYGIVAYESVYPEPEAVPGVTGLSAGFDASYLHLEYRTAEPVVPGEELLIGFDTYESRLGTVAFPVDDVPDAATGMEFVLRVRGEEAEVFAVAGYAIGFYGFASPTLTDEGRFQPIRILVNRAVSGPGVVPTPAQYWPAGILRHGDPDDRNAQWSSSAGVYRFRIPWTLLNVTDPSRFLVLHDEGTYRGYPEGQDILENRPSPGILLSVRRTGSGTPGVETLGADAVRRIRPPLWTVPSYQVRYKDSFSMIRDYLRSRDSMTTP